MKYRLFSATLLFLTLSGASSVRAQVSIPSFPSCPNPGGTQKVSYPTGSHGIAGQGEQTGSDSVYITGESTLVQCLCPDSGASGTQTNWLKVGDISESDKDYFKSQGWVFIPDGSAWGLDSAFYFAYNSSFSCGGNGGGGYSQPGPQLPPVCNSAKPDAPRLLSAIQTGSNATLTWTRVDQATHYTIYYGPQPGDWKYSVPNTGDVTSFTIGSLDPATLYSFEVRSVNNCMPSDPPAGIGGGQVLGAFAPTGNLSTIAVVVAMGLVFLGLSLLARKHEAHPA